MENGLYTAHEVAVILADAFGDDCACNFNGNDEWLPYLCELQDACPHPCGVACWEQYLKYKDRKEEILKQKRKNHGWIKGGITMSDNDAKWIDLCESLNKKFKIIVDNDEVYVVDTTTDEEVYTFPNMAGGSL